MTPLDGLERLLRERLLYHTELLNRAVEEGDMPTYHSGVLHGLVTAIEMLTKLRGK